MIYDYNLLLLRSPSVSFPSKLPFTAIHPSLFLCLPLSHPPLSLYTHACTHHTTYATPYTCTHHTHTQTSHTHTQHPTHAHTYLCSCDWQAEADREEHYFDRLEKKEMMEEKMKSITSMEVTVYTCAQVSGQFQVKKSTDYTCALRRSVASVSQKSTDCTCAQRRSVANVRSKKHWLHSAGQWPVSGQKSTDYTCTKHRSVADVRSKKHWLHMHTVQVSGQCQVKKNTDYTCAQRRSVADVRSKKHWLHMCTAQVSGQCQVKKRHWLHMCAGQWPVSGMEVHWSWLEKSQ